MLQSIEAHLNTLGGQIVAQLQAQIAQKHSRTGALQGSVSYSVSNGRLTVQAYDYIFSLGNAPSTLSAEPELASAVSSNKSMLDNAGESFLTTTLNDAYLTRVTNGFLDGVAEDIVADILGQFQVH